MWRVKGYVVSADLRVNGSKSTLAARVGAGGDCDAKVTLGAARQEYRQIGDLVYVMANRAYWTDSLGERDGRAVAKEAKGRWLRRSGPSARQSFCEGNYASPALISGARYSKKDAHQARRSAGGAGHDHPPDDACSVTVLGRAPGSGTTW